MFCKRCGLEIEDDAVICPHCGVAQKEPSDVVDNGGFGWGLLGCCIPIVGLILFLVWHDSKPRTAKAAGIGALISLIPIILYWVFFILLGVGVGMAGL